MKWIGIGNRKHEEILSESQKRMYRCAFTGHRPEKVVGFEGQIIVELRKEILKAIDEDYRVFLTGMSRGVDLWAADIVIELRRYNKDLKLMCIIPFEGMEAGWPVDWKKHFNLVRKHADYVHVLSDRYSPDAYQKRNAWLVNHSSRLIAVYTGEPSGTRNTIQYAEMQEIPTRIIYV